MAQPAHARADRERAAPGTRPGRAGRATDDGRPAVGRIWRVFAFLVVALRYPILLAWVVAAVAAAAFLPGITPAATLGSLLPHGAPALRAEYDAAKMFGLPLTSPAAVVQRDPHGFSQQELLDAVRRAAAVDKRRVPPIPGLTAAVPVANAAGAFPGSRERSTTIITFLFFSPGTSIGGETAAAETFAHRFLGAPQDHLAGVTGAAPAQSAQAAIIQHHLPWVELAAVLAVALIVALHFRSLVAPLATLLCAGVTYVVALHVVAWTASRAGVTVPPDLEPVLVVLLLGVSTDYCVFFLAGMRARLAAGSARLAAARRTTAEFTPIIVTAGLIVALGSASLALARLSPVRAFGPTLAITVLTAMLVAITLAPALISIFGGLLFRAGPVRRVRTRASRAAAPSPSPRGALAGSQVWTWRESAARLATARPVALLVTTACVAGLVIAALGVRGMRLGFPLIRALPAASEPARAEAAASAGFAPGILSPTEVLVLGPGVTSQQPALDRLQRALAGRPGVAGVVGPADLPSVQRPFHVTLASSGDAARYGVIQRSDPLGPAAIGQVRALRHDLPAMASAAGLTGVHIEVGGETALAGEAIDATVAGLWRMALAIALVIIAALAVFLRALIAPFYLLAASVLALVSALGLTVWIFQDMLGYGGLVYYVPFAVAVLLVSLGSDYSVFVVGRIWAEARRRPLRDAVAVAVPRASRAITTAGLALAAGFGVLALVPLDQFTEIAAAMVIGIVIDTFVVRSLLVPSLVVLSGRAGRAGGSAAGTVAGQAGGPAAGTGAGQAGELSGPRRRAPATGRPGAPWRPR